MVDVALQELQRKRVGAEELYTPRKFVDAILHTFQGVIHLDPAGSARANIPAQRLFTKEDDGLSKKWNGRIFLNPPYNRATKLWIARSIIAFNTSEIEEIILLLPNKSDTQWWHSIWKEAEIFNPVYCFVEGRIIFDTPYKEYQGKPLPRPYKWQADFPAMFVYLGPHQDRFIEAFSEHGACMSKVY